MAYGHIEYRKCIYNSKEDACISIFILGYLFLEFVITPFEITKNIQ